MELPNQPVLGYLPPREPGEEWQAQKSNLYAGKVGQRKTEVLCLWWALWLMGKQTTICSSSIPVMPMLILIYAIYYAWGGHKNVQDGTSCFGVRNEKYALEQKSSCSIIVENEQQKAIHSFCSVCLLESECFLNFFVSPLIINRAPPWDWIQSFCLEFSMHVKPY